MPIAELAAVTGTHQPSLYRLLRADEGLDLVEQGADGTYHELLGKSAFERLGDTGDEQVIFTEAMAEGTRAAAESIVASCDLSGTRRLADLAQLQETPSARRGPAG
jgi:hypothetical protein